MLNFENVQVLMDLNKKVLKDIRKLSFDVHLDVKILPATI